jgi:rfaE bifunctional protein kinase chain/domain/rfaE bifunctional protein nucleotidyltransferase chain/domain
MSKKINSIENLKKILFKLKTKRKKIVLCHGVFDLLHIGHINHFYEARNYGDILIVTVTSDQYVNKGPNRPAFNEENRLKALAALNVVDYVALNNSPTAISAIKELKPNVYCKGQDYKFHKNDVSGEIKNEINALKKNRGRIIFTKGATFSSSNLINKFSENYSPEQKTEINKIKKKFTFLKIRKSIESFKKLKVLIIGETIIDQYIFCEALGKSGKEPVLVLRDIKMEEYLGGAAAISRHLSQFCNSISLLSMIGEKQEFLGNILKNLPKNVNFRYIRKNNSPTIVKKRFLDNSANSNNKVLGVYTINDEVLRGKNEKLFNKMLKKTIPNYDLVIVSDYGHGFISKKSADLICKLSKYLALNAQVNAANVGYHSMRNYNNINCVIINETEIRHEMRNKNGKIEFLMKNLSLKQNIKNLIVTRGTSGSILFNKKDKKFNSCEAYAKTAIDKIGAGDAMLSIVALCLKCGFDKELALFVGSLAAAQSVESIGNKKSVNKIQILKTVENILK